MRCPACDKDTMKCTQTESLGQGLYRKTYYCSECKSTLIRLEKSSKRQQRERLEEARL